MIPNPIEILHAGFGPRRGAMKDEKVMLDTLKAGDTIKCTVTKTIRVHTKRETVTRLMRFDPDIKRALKKGQERRMRDLHVRTRGGRPFEMYKKAAKVAVPVEGASWEMTYFPHIKHDIESVTDCISIEKA
ncbi:MAG: hypothetical protein NXI14_02765 [bacterium]|nr:hypothetical protein [bacterium]